MRQYSSIKYIDIKEGSSEAFLRIESPASAENFLKEFSTSSNEYTCSILNGKDEENYWNKIKNDREDKLLKKIKIKKPKEKLINRILNKSSGVSTHIRFDADE